MLIGEIGAHINEDMKWRYMKYQEDEKRKEEQDNKDYRQPELGF